MHDAGALGCVYSSKTTAGRESRKYSSTYESSLYVGSVLKVVSATSYRPWRRAALIVPRPRWKPSDLPPTQAPVGGMLHWHAQVARSTASTPRMMQCCSSLTQRCSSATE
eukprot:scaffold68327_cov32-Phaeocystis_antarctica.AAC.2